MGTPARTSNSPFPTGNAPEAQRMGTPALSLPPLTAPLWTQEQAIAFEAACECISHVMAICSAELHRAQANQVPDIELVDSLRAQLASLALERSALHVGDDERVASVRAVYGARVRLHTQRLKHRAARTSGEA